MTRKEAKELKQWSEKKKRQRNVEEIVADYLRSSKACNKIHRRG